MAGSSAREASIRVSPVAFLSGALRSSLGCWQNSNPVSCSCRAECVSMAGSREQFSAPGGCWQLLVGSVFDGLAIQGLQETLHDKNPFSIGCHPWKPVASETACTCNSTPGETGPGFRETVPMLCPIVGSDAALRRVLALGASRDIS